MKKLTFDAVRDVLPHLDELAPFVNHLLASSEPDEAKAWSGSGQLDTVGSRAVTGPSTPDETERVAEREAQHLRAVYGLMARVVSDLADGAQGRAARALLEASALEEARDRPERAEAYARAAHRVARDDADKGVAALALRRWGRAARARGQLDEAHRRYEEAFEVARAVGDARGAAESAVGLGNVLEEQGRWSEAEAWYGAALEALADEPATPERWHALVNLHIVARSRGDIDESRRRLAEAEDAARALGDDTALPFLENARGQLRMAEGAFEPAAEHFRRALDAADGARALVTIRLNLAEALLARGRTLDAGEEARTAERDAVRAALVPKLPEVYRLLGRIAAADGEADAFVLFERALQIVREERLPKIEEGLTLQAYARAEARVGERESAEELLGRARACFDSVGVEHLRRSWADVYVPEESISTPTPEDEQDS